MDRSDSGYSLTKRAQTLNPKTCAHKVEISPLRSQPWGRHISSPNASLLIYIQISEKQ